MINQQFLSSFNLRRVLIAILWPSFISAGIALTAFYVWVDPLMIANVFGLPITERIDMYSISFLFLWGQAILASIFCLIFVAPTHHLNPNKRDFDD
ncbi:MAG: hypothetical protein AAF434_15560 [Pseudomonadota bacterium]